MTYINSDTTWELGNSPYVISDLVTVSPGVTLTIEPGVVIKFTSVYTGLVVKGSLVADGTPSQMIVFTSLKDDAYGGDTNEDENATSPAPGDWMFLNFNPESTNNLLDNVIIRYGGSMANSNNDYIYISSSYFMMTNSIVEHGDKGGLTIISASPSITGNIIRNNNGAGISLYTDITPTITGNTITGNNGYAISINSTSMDVTSGIYSNSITGNSNNGILLQSGSTSTLTASATWVADAPYVIGTHITVLTGATLTMQPGVVVKFASVYAPLIINGTLAAYGNPSQPVVFTSIKDDSYGGDTNGDGSATTPAPGDWGSLTFNSSSTGNLLDNVIVRYGGNSQGMITISTSSLTISSSTIEYSGLRGIDIYSGSPSITGNMIRNNNSIGIYLGSAATITGNTIAGNRQYGIYNPTFSIVFTAENNYWGDPSGPYDPSDDRAAGGWYNPSGTGDKVSDYVDYDPWLGSAPPPCIDNDADGYGSPGSPACLNGGANDCNDGNNAINPGAAETCDDIDNNCDGNVDEGLAVSSWYFDYDGDSYGNPSIWQDKCSQPFGYVADNTDCADNDENIYPGGPGTRVTGPPTLYYFAFQDAYDNAPSYNTIQSRDYTFTGNLFFNQSKSVVIQTGFECSYTTNSGITTIIGNMNISSGTVTIQGGTLKVQ